MAVLLPILLMAFAQAEPPPLRTEIRGRLDHADGSPAAGVVLELQGIDRLTDPCDLLFEDPGVAARGLTDEAGAFRLEVTSPGVWTGLVAVSSIGERVVLAEGAELRAPQDLQCLLPAERTRTIELRDVAGKPLIGRSVWVASQDFDSPRLPFPMLHRFMETDDFMWVLPPRRASRERRGTDFRRLETDRGGGLRFQTRLDRPELIVSDEYGIPHRIRLPREPATKIEIVGMHEVHEAELLITGEDEEPAVGAEVWIAASDCWFQHDLLLPAVVNEDGRWVALMENPRLAALAARWKPGEGWQALTFRDLEPLDDSQPKRDAFVLRSPRPSFVGAMDEAGRPLSAVHFEALPGGIRGGILRRSTEPVASEETSPGIYRIDGVTPYVDTLIASAPGMCSMDVPWNWFGHPQETEEEAMPALDAVVELHAAQQAEVRVIDSVSRRPIPGAFLQFDSGHLPELFAWTDEDGAWKGKRCAKFRFHVAFWSHFSEFRKHGDASLVTAELPLDLGPPPRRGENEEGSD